MLVVCPLLNHNFEKGIIVLSYGNISYKCVLFLVYWMTSVLGLICLQHCLKKKKKDNVCNVRRSDGVNEVTVQSR